MILKKTIALLAICAIFLSTALIMKEKGPKLKKVFNGKNLAGWKVPEGNIWWKPENGVLYARSGPDKKGSVLWTEKEYSDFIIQVDFKFGAGTVDSGIFIRNDTQLIKIGDSKSLKKDMTCSPYITGKGYPVEAKNTKELLKKDNWNTLKVKAVGKNYTVWLNGEKVLTYLSDTAIETGAVGLQLHPGRDMSIAFRNIKLAEL